MKAWGNSSLMKRVCIAKCKTHLLFCLPKNETNPFIMVSMGIQHECECIAQSGFSRLSFIYTPPILDTETYKRNPIDNCRDCTSIKANMGSFYFQRKATRTFWCHSKVAIMRLYITKCPFRQHYDNIMRFYKS
jgi:hypothetical protein